MKMLQGMKATLLLLNNLEHDNEEKTLEDSVAAIALKGRSNTKSRKLYSNRSAQPGGAATLYDAVKCGVFMEKAIMEKDDAEYLDEGGDEEEYVSGQVTRSVEEEENVSTNSESLQKRKKMVKPLVNDSTKSDDDKSEGQNLPEEDQNHPEESGQEQEIVIGDDAGVKEQDFLQESKQGEEMVNNDDDIREEDQNFLQKSEQEQEMVNDGVGKEEANVVQESEQKQKVGDESGETRDEILYRTATNVRRIIMERKKKRVSPKPQLKQPKATMSSVATPIGVFGKEEMVAAGKESGEFLEQEMVNDPKRLAKAPVQRAGVESVIHDWQKGELLGRGTFGSVYAGIADRGFFFAVKEVSLHDERVEGKQCIIQLEQEIALLRQFEHDNIVRYYGTQKDARHLYIFLELVTQGSLLRLYQNYDLKDPQVSGYTRQILHGLKYLHDRNVIHRDIKCANILVHTNGLVKLADFGLAKMAAKLNDVKSCKGTAFWMAPEVVRSKGYGLAADIWSLGCTVLEMLTRSFPFSGLEHMTALYKIGQGERPFVPDTLSSDAQDFILQCLQVNPSLRPTAAQLLDHPFVKRPLLKRPLPSSSGVASAHSFGWQF